MQRESFMVLEGEDRVRTAMAKNGGITCCHCRKNDIESSDLNSGGSHSHCERSL